MGVLPPSFERIAMRKYVSVALTSILVLLVGACAQKSSQASQQQPEYRLNTVKDVMDSIVDPASDFIWDAVETTVSAKGVEEKAPHTDEEWKNVRRHAIMLLEATNLLQIPGDTLPRPGGKQVNLRSRLPRERIGT